jgi:hypothetical protein
LLQVQFKPVWMFKCFSPKFDLCYAASTCFHSCFRTWRDSSRTQLGPLMHYHGDANSVKPEVFTVALLKHVRASTLWYSSRQLERLC